MKTNNKIKKIDIIELHDKLHNWWEINKRNFPWRKTKDPYKILIAEILLHRTKAEQVEPVYQKITENYPSFKKIKKITYKELTETLKPLGLKWRTDKFYEMIDVINHKFEGNIPRKKKDLKKLPGVSNYISSALRCFAYGIPEVILDTNTVRITGRLFGISINDNSRRSNRFKSLYERILDKRNPRNFNFAMIDLASLICHSKNPECNLCPINKMCISGLNYKNNI